MLIEQIPNYENAVIYVPQGSISAYKNEWSQTADFQEVKADVD